MGQWNLIQENTIIFFTLHMNLYHFSDRVIARILLFAAVIMNKKSVTT